jgi:hypothetical protein
MRRQRLRGLLLGRAVVPKGIIFRDDLDPGILLKNVYGAVGMALVDGISGDAAAEEDLALAVERVHQSLRRVLAEAGRDVAHVISARLGYGRAVHEEQDTLLAAALDCPVERGRREREADDAVGLRVDHALVSRDLTLRVRAGDHLLELDHLIVGRRLRESLHDVGGLGLPGVAAVAETQEYLELLRFISRRRTRRDSECGCERALGDAGGCQQLSKRRHA